MAFKIPQDLLMMLELAVMSVHDGISMILTQSQKQSLLRSTLLSFDSVAQDQQASVQLLCPGWTECPAMDGQDPELHL